MMSRKEQQAELLIKFGELISPLEDLIKYPHNQTAQTRSKASAKFAYDRDQFVSLLNEFTRGESGHNYSVELKEITAALNGFTNQLMSFRDDATELAERLQLIRDVTTRNILAIPCDIDSAVLEAGSPFSAFVKLRSICETANDRLLFVDPYMGQGAVRRYFHGIPKHVSVGVITKRRGGQEFADFIDISKLFADERGPEAYRLMYHANLHDRYLQCDNTVYHLGGSFKDAGRKSDFTVTQIQLAPDGEAAIHTLLTESTETFGPATPIHPAP
ncbi:hypothetical protein [Gimesia sp.]|uniref:hypothetical protein n=1 Tax=Gimesia sp. TaxID=2024833 RepID=UPI003A92642D